MAHARQEKDESLLAAVFDAALDGVIVMDSAGRVVDLNPAAERTFGYSRREALGDELASLIIPPSLRERHRDALRGFLGKRKTSILDRRVEFIGMRSDGSEFPVELTVTQVADSPPVFAGYVRDITERRKESEAKDLLASASAAFDSSLDPRATMRTVARTAVPKLAELCVIDLIREDGMIGDSVVAALDPGTERRLEELRVRHPLDPAGAHPVARALRSREPLVIHDLTNQGVLGEVAQSEEHRGLIEHAGYQSAVVMKLAARGRMLGALSFLHMQAGSKFDPDHLGLMQDLANRAATALDNATLYADRARIAHTLQRSLMPDALPVVEGLGLASTFHPVGEGVEVGGDFHDVFQTGAGCWMVVGDVCGKGTEAAALTSLVRHSVRALAFVESSPARVLHSLNEVMYSHELAGRFATVILARFDLLTEPVKVTLASAGHPPPILLNRQGQAKCLDVSGTLLGIFEQMSSEEIEVDLQGGETLILFTDGLLDAGAPRHELSTDELCSLLDGRAERSPAALVSELEEIALTRGEGHLRDDIATLAARVEV